VFPFRAGLQFVKKALHGELGVAANPTDNAFASDPNADEMAGRRNVGWAIQWHLIGSIN